jgi:hypothetical protein
MAEMSTRRLNVITATVTAAVVVLVIMLLSLSGSDSELTVFRNASAVEVAPDEIVNIGTLDVVATATPTADIDLVNGTASLEAGGCLAVRALMAAALEKPDGIATTKIPGIDLAATFENVVATIRCGSDNSISLRGTLRTDTVTLTPDITLRWPDFDTLVPDVRLTSSVTSTAGEGLKVSDLVVPLAGLIGLDLTATDLPADLELTSTQVDAWWPRQGQAWLDLTLGSTLTTNQGDRTNVNVLVSATRDADITVLWGLHVDPPTGSTVNLASLLANDSLSWLGSAQFPELLLGYVTPSERRVVLADLPADRTMPRTFFAGKRSAPTENAAFDATLRATASMNLDVLGANLRHLVGYAPGAQGVFTGAMGLNIGDLLNGDGSIGVTSLAGSITMPAVDGAASTVLPDGVRLGDTRVEAAWSASTNALTATLSADASIDLPDPSKPGGIATLNPTLTAQYDDPGTGDSGLLLQGAIPGTTAAPAWPDAFGLTWFDLSEVSTTLDLRGGNADLTAFGIMNLGGAPVRVDLTVNSGAAGTTVDLDASTSEQVPLSELARQWGLTLSDEFDLTVGGNPDQSARFQGQLIVAPDGTVSGGLGFRAASALTLGTSTFDADLLLSIGFEPDGTTSAFGGARLGTTTMGNLVGAVSGELGEELATTNLGAVTLPTTGVVLTSEPLRSTSTDLSAERRTFFDPLFGCEPSRPCDYRVDLAPGVHLLSDFALPRQSGSTSKVLFDEVYRAFWMDEPPTAQLALSLTLPEAGQPLVSDGFDARINLGIRPDPARQADWFRFANLDVGLKVTATGVAFDLGGQLGIRLLDDTRTTAMDCGAKTWVADNRPGGGGCYDELDVAVASALQLGATNRFTLAGSVIAENGWSQPLGIEFLEFSAAVAQIDVTVDATGPNFQLGFYVSGRMTTERGDRDLAGSMVVGLRPVAAPPYVVPTFGGLRVSSRGGLDLADLMLLAGTSPAADVDRTPPPDIVTASLRNAEFMVGTGDYPSLCISTGVRFSAELYVGTAPTRVSTPGETPRTCTPHPVDAPVTCRQAATPCTAAMSLRAGVDGLALVGAIDRFTVGRVTWSNAELVFDLASASPRLRVAGQAEVNGLGRGGIDLSLDRSGARLNGDVELFAAAGGRTKVPPLRASVSATVTGDAAELLSPNPPSTSGLDLYVQLQSDVGELVRTAATDALRSFSDTVLLLDAIYQDLKANDGDVLRTLRTVPKALHERGVRVPTWVYNPTPLTVDVTVVAGLIDDFVTRNRLPRPTFGQIFSGTPLNPPILGISRIPGIKDYIPTAPGSFTEFLDTIIEPAITNQMRRLGVPSDLTFAQVVADLQADIDSIDIPVVISCADFRLELNSTSKRTTLRVAGEAFTNPIGINLTWDLSKSFWDQLSRVGPTLVRQLFQEPTVVDCGTAP